SGFASIVGSASGVGATSWLTAVGCSAGRDAPDWPQAVKALTSSAIGKYFRAYRKGIGRLLMVLSIGSIAPAVIGPRATFVLNGRSGLGKGGCRLAIVPGDRPHPPGRRGGSLADPPHCLPIVDCYSSSSGHKKYDLS